MKQIYLILLPLILFACAPHFPDVMPGSTQMLKGPDNRMALLSVPADYTPKKRHILFIALHGGGDIAPAFHDLWKIVCDSLGIILLTPQGTEKSEIGFGWTLTGNSESFLRSIVEEARKRVNIDPDRIYIGGFSAGGSLAYYMALRYPHIFSGVIALGASFQNEWISLAKPNDLLKRQRIYIGHGDLESNIDNVSQSKDLLKQAGVTVDFSVYKNTGHAIPEPKLDELLRALRFITEK
ncbi:alpha/beta hydrolase fold domain-containing protein [bacterium]|nr:MAG: alpha/beta hydrolase fold domain-containing protein [bacterium]